LCRGCVSVNSSVKRKMDADTFVGTIHIEHITVSKQLYNNTSI